MLEYVVISRDFFMKKIIISYLFANVFLLTGCAWLHPYQPDIQQGNIFSQASVEKIRPGMSKVQVEDILGSPVLSNPFDENHWAYVYTFQHNGGMIIRKNLDIYFRGNQVVNIKTSEGKIS